MRNLLSNSLKVCAFVLSTLLSLQASAQQVGQSLLNCPSPRGTSQDLSVVDVFVDAPACATCIATGGNVTYPLKMTIHNGTKSDRTAFALYGTLSADASINGFEGNIVVCVGAITVASDEDIGFGLGNQTFTVGTISFPCNADLSLTNNILAWTDAAGTTTDRCNAFLAATKCQDVQPKCDVAASINIRQPLSFTKSQSTSCSNSATGSVTVAPIGGTSPYTIVIDGTTFNNVTTSATRSDLAAATYNFTVTDAAGCSASSTQTVGSIFCCTPPTVNADPTSTDACPEGTASFTAGATGGDPAPTVQWWKKGPSDAGFSSVTNGAVYSGATTTTLSIAILAGLNNYQYKAIFTSAGCTPDESAAATLTVKTPPPAASTIYHPPACDKTTFSVEVTNVVNGATYTIKKGDGSSFAAGVVTPSDAIVASSTANITFSNIPAGSGFQVSVSKDGCSPAGAPLSCTSATVGTPATARATNTTTMIEFGESETTKVKAYPNPFSDRVKFMVTSSVAGNGNLEVYNMMGQKVKTVYQGYIAKGTQTFELSLPNQSVGNLVYVLRIGDKKMTGKILQINR